MYMCCSCFILCSGLVVTSASASLHLRRSILRYALLAYVLCLRGFSASLKRQLPTAQEIIDLGWGNCARYVIWH